MTIAPSAAAGVTDDGYCAVAEHDELVGCGELVTHSHYAAVCGGCGPPRRRTMLCGCGNDYTTMAAMTAMPAMSMTTTVSMLVLCLFALHIICAH